MSIVTRKRIAITAAILLTLALLGGYFANREWLKIKTEYGIDYSYLHVGLSGTLSTANLQFKNAEIGEGKVDTAFVDIDLWKLIKGEISIGEILLDGAKITILASDSEGETTIPKIESSKIFIRNVDFTYLDTDTVINLQSGTLQAQNILYHDSLSVDSLKWSHAYTYLKSSEEEVSEETSTDTSDFQLSDLPKFEVGFLNLDELNFTYADDSSKFIVQHFKFSNAHISNHSALELQFDTLALSLADTLPLGLAIANTQWVQNDPIKSENLKIGMPGLKFRVNTLSIKPGGNYDFDINLDQSEISYATLYQLDIGLEDIFNQSLNPEDVITLSGNISGNTDQVNLNKLNAKLLKQTQVVINGGVEWASDDGMLDLHISNFSTTRNDISALLEPAAYNDFFSWPSTASGPVSITGDFNNYLIKGSLNTPEGLLELTSVVNFPAEEDIFYSISLGSDRALINGLVDYLPIDISQAKVQIDIGGLLSDIETRDTFLMDLHLYDFTAEGYDLKNLTFDYYYNNDYDSLWVILDDEALQLNMKGAVMGGDTGSVPFAVNIAKAAPGLLDSIIPAWTYSGNLDGAYRYAGDDYFEILLDFRQNNMLWAEAKSTEPIKDFSLDVKAKGDRYNMDFSTQNGDVLNTTFYFPDYNYDDLGMLDILDSMPEFALYSKLEIDSSFAQKISGVGFDLSLEHMDVKHLREKRQWQLDLNLPSATYEDVLINDLDVTLHSDHSDLNGQLQAGYLQYSIAEVSKPFFEVIRDSAQTLWRFESEDINELGATYLHALQTKVEKGYKFNFTEADSLIIAGNHWGVYNNEGLILSNEYKLAGGNLGVKQNTAILDLSSQPTGEVVLKMDSISLFSLLAPFIDSMIIDGHLSAIASYNPTTTNADFSALLSHVGVDSIDLGRWKIDGNYGGGKLLAEVNNKTLTGRSHTQITYENEKLDFSLNFESFNLSFLNSTLEDYELGISGLLNGQLKGTYTDELDTKGWLQVNQGSFDIPYLQTSVSLDKDSLYFEDKKLVFREFKITDPYGENLYVDGILDLLPDLIFDLDITGKNYTFLNQNTGKIVSGKASADIDLRVKGTPQELNAKGELTILPASHIKYILPDDVQAVQQGGDIQFVSFDETDTAQQVLGTTSQDINLDIVFKLDKSDFELIINPVTQEYVKFEALGEVTLSKDGTDAPVVFGEINSNTGRSRIDLPIVPALNLDIEKATLKWHGPYDDPLITFRGVEGFKSSVSDIPGLEHRSDIIPVTLQINLTEVSVNDIQFTFDLSSSDQELDAYLKSETPEERENMATNLLLFGTLYYGGEDGADKMMSSVTSKLNEIANRNLTNTDLYFNVDNQKSYNQAGEEVTTSKLNYNLRRGFYNDRVFFTLGGDLGLTSSDPSVSTPSSHFIGNVGVEYILIPGGPWTVKAARNERYEGIIDGDIVEYKLGIGFYKSYPTFWSIFNQEATKPEEEEVKDEE